MEPKKIYTKLIINIILTIIGILCLIFIVPKLISFFLPFVIGAGIAVIANPLVRFLERRLRIVRKTGSAIVIIGAIVLVIGVIYGLGYVCITQMMSFLNDIPRLGTQMEGQILQLQEKYIAIYAKLPEMVQGWIDRFIVGLRQGILNYSGSGKGVPVINQAGDLARNVADMGFLIMMTLLSAYFFVADRDQIVSFVKRYAPRVVLENYRMVSDNMKTAFGGYLKAQLKIMLVLIVIMFLGFWIMGIDYAFLLAVLIAFLDFLPVFGTGTVLWPWAIIEFLSGNAKKTICILVIYLVCQVVKQVIEPKMIGDSVGISPLQTLLFLFLGYRFYGVLGMILGVPVGMICCRLIQMGLFRDFFRGGRQLIEEINQLRKS